MTEKNKKLLIVILSALVVALAVALAIVLVAQAGKGPDTQGPSGPEIGTYYFDSGIQEYTLTLSSGNQFALYIKGATETGNYTLTDKALSLDFAADGVETLEATLENDVVTLTYNGATMRMLKKINYTISFEVNGGNSLEEQQVLNGKPVSKPADPVREGFVFVGWYADNEYKTPFAFGAEPVTGDMTLYARWSEDLLGGKEYSVNLDANYEGAENPAPMLTVGGKLFGLPVLSREGYQFQGWWLSMADNGQKLTARYEEGTALDAGTTLYALWQSTDIGSKLHAPVVSVAAGSIRWNAVDGARSYSVTIVNADGIAVVDNEPTGATTFNVPFDTYEAGEYEIRVTALANTGEADNSEAVRYFNNKALGLVSRFEVIDSMLIFNAVEHAEKYLITVICGDEEHQHTLFDNGNSRTFNFANCEMTEGGIRFVVTAVAEGYGPTTSREFVYCRDLAPVEDLRYDEATQTVHWNEVSDAAYYMVSVKCGNAAHNHAFQNNGGQTSISLKECDACEGGILVKVYPKTRGYNSPVAAELAVNKKGPATPSGIRVNGTVLTWDAVTGAAKYEVQVGEQKFGVSETAYDLSGLMNWAEGSEYAISLRAIGEGESAWSDVLNIRYHQMGQNLSYSRNTLSWLPVIGATAYEIQINDGEIITVEDGSTSVAVTLTQAGVNVLKVRYVDGGSRSDWAQTEVYAHEVTFDTRGGGQLDVRYLAVGDETRLPATTKDGYDFAAWYNVPGGPSSNGMAYTDELFAEVGSIVLYAHYAPKAYNITYNYGDGGTGEQTMDQVRFETHYQLVVPTPNAPTGAFGGWFSAPYGMGIQYTDPKGNSLAPWPTAGDAEVYAYWIDSALSFSQSKINGEDGYIVSAGDQIALLQEVTIPATYNGLPVLMLAGNAFKDCTSLQVINMPASLKQISVISPFTGCTQLQAVNVYPVEGVNNHRYWSEDGVLFDNGTAATAQPKLLLMPLAKTGAYRIPNGVAEIPERAFANSLLEKIIISADVTKIGQEAFAGCTKLTAVHFETSANEKGLTIGDRAFSGCTALQKIILPKRLEQINLTKYSIEDGIVNVTDTDNAFVGCTSLVSITVVSGSKNYKSVDGVLYSGDGKTLLYCPSIKEGAFAVPAGTVSIAPGAFIGCDALTEITLPNTVTLVSECAFYGIDGSLEKITFGGKGFNEVIIDKYAFRACTSLKEVVFESGSRITTLGEGAFYGCTNLASFEIPASMTRIQAEAFRNCTSLATISFAANGKTLAFGENVFFNCTGLTTVDLPAYVSEIPGIFGGCASLQAVNVAEDSQYLTSVDGVVFNKDMTEILFFPQGKTGTYSLPVTVTTIANGVFAQITGLKKLTLTASLTTIGDNAFRNCTINQITFGRGRPSGNLTIGKSAFEGATFGTLTLPNHTTVIGDYAFAGTTYSQIELNDGIESLGSHAFYGATGSGTITVPASVKTIGDYCFASIKDGLYTYGPVVSLKTANSQLLTIGDYAFANNGNVHSLTIPASVTSIGNYAFSQCTGIGTITFAANSSLKTIGAHAFESCGTNFDYNLTTITIPKSVTSIGAYAFVDCRYLEAVVFEDGGTEDLVLGNVYAYAYQNYNHMTVRVVEHGHVFENCYVLKSVTFPSHLTEIAPYTFKSANRDSNENLRVTFPENSRLTTIGDYAFYGCNLGSITIPKSVRNLEPVVDSKIEYSYDRMGIGAYAFAWNYDTLTTVIFEKGGAEPLTIGQNAFENADLLLSIEFPARLASYTSYTGDVYAPFANGAMVFEDAENLQSVTVEAGGQCYVDIDGVVYTADRKELVMCPAAKTGSVQIPATVTKIHDRAFYACTKLETVTFVGGNEPMTIGDEAFSECGKLKSIVLPTNVVALGERVFADSAFEDITLSKNLEHFDAGMIENCTALKGIHVEQGSAFFASDSGVLYNAAKTELLGYPSNRADASYTVLPTVTVIKNSAFRGNKHVKTVVLPAGLVEIEEYAFAECTALTAINIPNTVELIDTWAFGNCYSLSALAFETGGTCKMVVGSNAFRGISTSDLMLPATMAVVGDYAFLDASIRNLSFEENSNLLSLGDEVFKNVPLTTVTFPDSLSKIGNKIFSGCQNLKSVVFGAGLVSIGSSTFISSTIESVYFPASLQSLGSSTFADCQYVKDVTFAPFAQLAVIPEGTFAGSSIEYFRVPASVTEIADAESARGAFADCVNLRNISFAEGSKCAKIGKRAFLGCIGLTEFTIPVSISTLGESAFEGCEGLTRIEIPAGVTQMGSSVFSSCTGLTEVVLNTKATELPGFMFANCRNLTQITIPASVSSIGNSCFTNTGIAAIEVADGSLYFVAVDGVLFNADMSRIEIYPAKKADTSFTIPNTVTVIQENVLGDNAYLTDLMFADGETPLVIEERAFASVDSLIRVTLPERLTTMGDYAFAFCGNLMFINVPASTGKDTFQEHSFVDCDKLLEICNQSALEITAGSTDFGYIAENALNVYTPTQGESKIVEDENGFIVFTDDANEVYLVSYSGTLKELVIPDYITHIYKSVFANSDIVKVTIPEGVKSIGSEAFYYCKSLTEVSLPSTLTSIGEKAFTNCSSLFQVAIPESVTEMAYYAFRYCNNTLFLVGHNSQPAQWDSYWISSTSPIIWGYDGAERTYTFRSNGGNVIDPITTAYAISTPVPTRAGYVFMGWYDNAQFTGNAISGAYYSTSKTTLYAKWLTQAEFEAIVGTGFNNAIVMSLDTPVTVTIDEPGECVYLVFHNTGNTAAARISCDFVGAEVSVHMYRGENHDTDAEVLYNVEGGRTFYLMEGITYFVIYMEDGASTGTFNVTLTTNY